MSRVVHYLLTFGDWLGASFWRSAIFMSVVIVIVAFAG